MRSIWPTLEKLALSHKTTLTAMGAAVTVALYGELVAGRFEWRPLLIAAFAVAAGIGRSPVSSAQTPPGPLE